MKWFIDMLLKAWDGTTRIKVLVHEAFLVDRSQEPFYFVKVINSSPENVFTITHVWLKDGPQEIEIINPERPLPHKLEASDIWEIWFPKKLVADQKGIFKNIHVELSNGKTYKSKRNSKVRPAGFVA